MVTRVPKDPVVDALREEWSTLDALVSGLDDAQWSAASTLPGWTVGDIVAHIVGTERSLRGEQVEAIRDVAALDHVKNPIGELNERWLDHYRARSRDELMTDFRTVTQDRLTALEGMTEREWDAEGFTPAGPDSYGRFMRIRIFDCWVHEIDIRDSLGLGAPDDPMPATSARKEMVASLPFVVGKRAGAAPGSAVTVEFTGLAPRTVHLAVEDRAAVVPALSGPADTTLTVDLIDYVRLIGGRPAADPERVRISGDRELGEKIVTSLHYMI
ncbi:MAG: maleylpyruvate isomerase family mycothiol-dependent enzyme [Gordonia sp. (in: high G+C Gram-positive bacteria)]|uniref:maleylpyruvate isomerase family mycothiol-dependent enzyme n=1 Tax=Gordonia sp. (in: high G+C Gram-positive bacteria) TaxID=84139 RepID=UPI0039E6E148